MDLHLQYHNIGIWYSPKSGSTSIATLFFNHIRKTQLSARHIRSMYGHNVHRMVRKTGLFQFKTNKNVSIRIAIHRDPVDRFRSMYDDRVKFLGVAKKSIEEIADIDVINSNEDLSRHATTQTFRLGADKSRYDIVLTTQELYLLPTILEELTGEQWPTISCERQRAKTKPSNDVVAFVQQHYAEDYANGWDGVPS